MSIDCGVFQVGDTALIRVKHWVLNPVSEVEVLTDPSDITLFVQEPDAVVTTIPLVSIIQNAVGDYQYGFPITQSGLHAWRWVSVGPAAGVEQGYFEGEAALAVP